MVSFMVARINTVTFNGNLFMGIVWVSILLNIRNRNGIDAPALIWASFLPAVAALFLNLSSAIFWSIVYTLTAITLFILQTLDLVSPSSIPIEQIRALKLLAFVWVLFVSAVIQVHFRRTTTQHRRELEKEQNETKTLLRVLCHDLDPSLEILSRFVTKRSTENLEDFRNNSTAARVALSNIQDIIGQVRDWEKIGSGVDKGPLVPVQIKSVIHALYGKFILQLQAKNITFEFEKGSGLSSVVLADSLQLIHQVFGNLMSNAIKFTPAGGKIIFRAVKGGQWVHLILADTGVGMQKDWITRAGIGGEIGTGFGLPIVLCYIERMGGTIRIRSTEMSVGKTYHGTVVRITLPAVEDISHLSHESPKALFLKVLVVDDSQIYHELTKEFLTELYCTCRMETTTSAALEALHEESFDAILVDSYLATESGYLLAKQIRTDHRYSKSKIYYFSATVPSKEDKPLSFEQVYDGYILKPLDQVQLRSMLSPIAERMPIADSLTLNRMYQTQSDQGTSLLDSLCRIFFKMIPQYTKDLRYAIQHRDVNSVKLISHKIRSNSESLSLIKLSRVAEYLEMSTLNYNKDSEWICKKLEEETTRALEYLEAKQFLTEWQAPPGSQTKVS
jgi:signal transduction histidine kinase/DNA-binding NarL/FixJ family response regulator